MQLYKQLNNVIISFIFVMLNVFTYLFSLISTKKSTIVLTR